MPAQSYVINFNGYWTENNKGSIPVKSGIFCVYTCIPNAQKNTVSLQKLIYIGEAENVNSRISNHYKQKDWESHLKPGEQLCYSFGPVNPISRKRCEAALIFEHKPPDNIVYVDTFRFDQTTLMLTGKIRKLRPSFTVNHK